MVAEISTRNQATMEKSYLLLKLKACAAQLVALFERLDWKTPCLMHTLAKQLRSSHIYTWAFYASVNCQSLGNIKSWRYSFLKSAWRDHTRCTNRHKIDRTTFCSLAGLNTSLQEKAIEFSILHRYLTFSFVYWYNRHVLLLLMIRIMYRASTATTYFIAE